jgi:hypothetical protein
MSTAGTGQFGNLMHATPVAGSLTKAKFKQPKPLTNARGRSVP